MAAPNGTIWGSIVTGSSSGRKGKLGIYIKQTDADAKTTVNVQIWFATIYSCSDGAANTLYLDIGTSVSSASTAVASNVDITHTIATGTGWNTSNQTCLLNKTYTYDRGTSAKTYKVYAKFSGIDMLGSPVSANTPFTVPKLAQFTISYDKNGGTTTPSSVTKYYGKNITVAAGISRNGYKFKSWNTKKDGSGTSYSPGDEFSTNADTTLYAQWTPNTYKITYNANGGNLGNVSQTQTKTHDVDLKLDTDKPTRTNYNFLGWATSKSATTKQYDAGDYYKANAAATLYAVWELAYVKPTIYNLTATRCDSTGAEADDGTYAVVEFEWKTTNAVTAITIAWESASAGSGSNPVTASGTGSKVHAKIGGSLSVDAAYTITVSVKDSETSTAITTLSGSMFPIDAKAGGDGVSFGKPAELGAAESLGGAGVADFGYDAKFNEPVYGNVLGLNRLPQIPNNSELDDYLQTGCWACYKNDDAKTITCGGVALGTDDTIPPARAFRFEVSSSTGEGIRPAEFSYLRQKIIPYNKENPTLERDVTRGIDNKWAYSKWWKSNLTPAVSKKIYSKAAMTIALSTDTTLGTVNDYTKIPFNTTVMSTSDRLTLSSNSIRIGENIQYIKVSGQALIDCKSVSGLRHIRIRKVSGSSTYSVVWMHIPTDQAYMLYPVAPIIVDVKEGDLLEMVLYTGSATDTIQAGSNANGRKSYLTVEEL